MRFFTIEMEVRDNELDAQGIVNNSNYMVYFSHARHKHINSIGINFDDYNKEHQKLVVLGCTIKFKNSLRANDVFTVSSKIAESQYPNQWLYNQDIKRLSDGKLVARAIFSSTCVNDKATSDAEKLYIPTIIKDLIA